MVFLTCFRMSAFYAVRIGRKPDIYNNWRHCFEQVNQFRGAVFKKFEKRGDAELFISDDKHAMQETFRANEALREILKKHLTDNLPPPEEKVDNALLLEEVAKRRTKKRILSNSDDVLQSTDDTISTSPPNPKKTLRQKRNKKYTVVYTDGCCLNMNRKGSVARGGIGVFWGVDDPRNVAEPLMHPRQTNIEAEINATIKAIEQALEQDITHLEIRTDCEFTIKAITKWYKRWILEKKEIVNRESLEKLYKLTKQLKQLRWTHVRGHMGIEGNEYADKLAKMGAEMQNT